MEYDKANQRANELLEPINQALMLCDNQHDLLILCFAMMNRSRDIIDKQLGESKRKNLFSEHAK